MGFGLRGLGIMENQMEKKMENEMETREYIGDAIGLYGARAFSDGPLQVR